MYNTKSITIALILIVVFFLGRGCNNKVITPNIDAKAIGKNLKKQLIERNVLKGLAVAQTDTVTKYRNRYIYVRDTLIKKLPCETVLNIVVNTCDSALNAQCDLLTLKDSIIQNNDSIIGNYQKLVKIDSCTIGQLTKEVKKQKRKVILWKVISVGEAALLGVSILNHP